jgi:signal transduction histidine kinase/CheY-like chemotaxis protein
VMRTVHTIELRHERDVVLVRQLARDVAALLGFEAHDQTRIATAVSEAARGLPAGAGRVAFCVRSSPDPALVVRVDGGRAATLPESESPYPRLVDEVRRASGAGGRSSIELVKRLGRPVADLDRIAASLGARPPQDPYEEIRRQNEEITAAVLALRERQEELTRLNKELEDTNRGVVALYAELDDKAESLQRVTEVKSRFLSNMSHEFRTPLNSILSLARLLLGRVDGDLTPEQDKQVQYILRSAETLSELINDLLDLAKVEAGKLTVRSAPFEVADLLSGLRGMLRPLLGSNSAVQLVVEEPPPLPTLESDEGKVGQVLRNFVSNALKFTDSGEVRVRAEQREDGEIVFSVSDTGIGIAPQDQERIFDEFTQVENPIQKKVRGTGLGLPLSRRLAELLGGRITLDSEPGRGSTFRLHLPASCASEAPKDVADVEILAHQRPVLIVEDDPQTMELYLKYLEGTPFVPIPTRNGREARQVLAKLRPAAVLLDIIFADGGSDPGWNLLAELKTSHAGRGVPVIVATIVDNEAKALSLGASAFHLKPLDRDWLLDRLSEAAGLRPPETLLVVDDDEVSRYLIRGLLPPGRFRLLEASGGADGIRLARDRQPAAVLLDLGLPDLNGFRVVQELRDDVRTRDIPVIVYTSRMVSREEREALAGVAAIVSKESPSREAARETLLHALAKAGVPRSTGASV